MLISTGGGGSSSEAQWNPTEPPGPGTRPPTQVPSRALPAGLQPFSLSPVTTRPPHGLSHPADQSSSHTRDPGGCLSREACFQMEQISPCLLF